MTSKLLLEEFPSTKDGKGGGTGGRDYCVNKSTNTFLSFWFEKQSP
jgi:hypothetical protein